MTFESISDLRRVLVRIFGVLLGFVIGWEFRIEIRVPLESHHEALADNGIYHYQAISIAESIVVYLKSKLNADFPCSPPSSSPDVDLYWPGTAAQREDINSVTFFSVIFFIIGAAFAYTVIVPFITNWLVQLTLEDGQPR